MYQMVSYSRSLLAYHITLPLARPFARGILPTDCPPEGTKTACCRIVSWARHISRCISELEIPRHQVLCSLLLLHQAMNGPGGSSFSRAE